jgi:hypothetical protein
VRSVTSCHVTLKVLNAAPEGHGCVLSGLEASVTSI